LLPLKALDLKSSPKSIYFYALILSVLICIVFNRLFFASFISWDDADVLLNNKDVHHFNLRAFFTKHYVGNYAPITMITFAIDWLLFKGSSALHHSVNLLFHLFNSILVFKLAESLFKNKWRAFFVSCVFCFHPLQIETIAWVAAKNNLVYTSFFLMALISYVKFKTIQHRKFYFYAFGLFVLSALSKPSAICFPVSLFAIDYILSEPISLKSIINKIPYFIVSLIIGLVTIYTRTEDKFMTNDHLYSFIERIGFAGYAIGFYVYKFLLPFNLSAVYPYPQQKLAALVIGYAIVLLLGTYVFILIKKKNYLVLGSIGFILSHLLLVLQFIPFGEVITADRYMYMPLIGFGFLVLFLFNISDKTVRLLTVFLILYFGSLSFSRTLVWKNSITLFADTAKKFPKSFLILNSLGAEYMLNNNSEKAYVYLNREIDVSTNYYKGYYNRGLLNAKNNKYNEAINDLTKAIEYHKLKNNIKAYVARGNVYYNLKDYSKAIKDAEQALIIDSKSEKALFLLANCHDDLGMFDKALTYYNKAISINPEDANYYLRRAIVFGKMQQFQKCLMDLDNCTNLNSKYAEAYYWKGVVKFNLKQNPCEDLKIAVDLGFTLAQKSLNNYCR
jgi:protein O-mannosyl-transferase